MKSMFLYNYRLFLLLLVSIDFRTYDVWRAEYPLRHGSSFVGPVCRVLDARVPLMAHRASVEYPLHTLLAAVAVDAPLGAELYLQS